MEDLAEVPRAMRALEHRQLSLPVLLNTCNNASLKFRAFKLILSLCGVVSLSSIFWWGSRLMS